MGVARKRSHPRNFEIYAALVVKSFYFVEAWILVFIESAGKSTASMHMPAKPPAMIEAKAAFLVGMSDVLNSLGSTYADDMSMI